MSKWKRPPSTNVNSGVTPWLRDNIRFKVAILHHDGNIRVYDKPMAYFRVRSKRFRRWYHRDEEYYANPKR